MIDLIAIVERNDLIESGSSRRYGLIQLRLDREIDVLPGQFAMLKPHGGFEPLLRRAMAYYRSEATAGSRRVEFIYQVLGRGTQSLSRLRAGDRVDFLGSLGNSFDIDAAVGREALLVAGGVGSAALFMLAQGLLERDIRTTLFIGGANRGDLCGIDDFIELLAEERVLSATVDGSHGEKGFVTAPFERYLRNRHGDSVMIYGCGPDPMLHRVSQIAEEFSAPSELSLESPMACGFGICVGCAVAVKADCPEGFVYRKVCTDGPVFRGSDLYWP